jgi:ATP-dependent RNA helicase DDX1
VWHGSRSTHGISSGKCYFEATVTDEGLCRIGWSTSRATHELGKDNFGFGFGGTGKKSFSSQFDDYGEPFGKDDTIGCYIDTDGGSVSFSKNGKSLGKAFDIPKHLHGDTFFAAVTLKNAEMRFNFGDTPFNNPPQAGYCALSKAGGLVPFQSCGTESRPGKREGSVMALIMEPARELAQQTHDNISRFKRHLTSPGVRELLLVGGDSAKDQMRALQEGVDIVTGTPGRLDDFISTGKLDLSGVRFFVLDEADGLLSSGHGNLITKIYNQIPKVTPEGARLQMIVCSATLHNVEVKKLANKLMHFPMWVDLKGQDSVPETVHHVVCHVNPVTDTAWYNLGRIRVETDGVHAGDNVKPGSRSAECLSEGVKLLKAEYLVRVIRKHKMDQAIIFCRTKLDCDNIERYLMKIGGGSKMVNEFSCVCLHSDRRPQERKDNLLTFKNGEVRFLICTDVAARGIDITGVPFVVNVTLPDDKQNYIHRIGRIGRAERMGLAISIVSNVKEKVWYHKCPSRGKSCHNTNLLEEGGCTIWYDERQYLSDIEEHLGVTIPQVDNSFDVPVNEFDGKITYGERRGKSTGTGFQYHTVQLAPSRDQLMKMEKLAQSNFLRIQTTKTWFS